VERERKNLTGEGLSVGGLEFAQKKIFHSFHFSVVATDAGTLRSSLHVAIAWVVLPNGNIFSSYENGQGQQ